MIELGPNTICNLPRFLQIFPIEIRAKLRPTAPITQRQRFKSIRVVLNLIWLIGKLIRCVTVDVQTILGQNQTSSAITSPPLPERWFWSLDVQAKMNLDMNELQWRLETKASIRLIRICFPDLASVAQYGDADVLATPLCHASNLCRFFHLSTAIDI
jgi:hypothetical protein